MQVLADLEDLKPLAARQYDRLPDFVADLIRREASVLVATTTPGVLAAKAATTTIPIVFATDQRLSSVPQLALKSLLIRYLPQGAWRGPQNS